MRAYSRRYSSWRAEGDLSGFFREHGLVALAGIDTRRLTRHIRERGAMPAAMGGGASVRELTEMAAAAPVMTGQDLASAVSTADSYTVSPAGATRGRVVAIDLGIKRDILEHLTGRGLEVRVMPSGVRSSEILANEPDGVFLSNGPGDPEPLGSVITSVRGILGRTPVFGICLGQQVLGLALGARTYKLPFGHHGGNHPVRRLADNRVEITSQNHGFAVDLWSLSADSPPGREGLVTPRTPALGCRVGLRSDRPPPTRTSMTAPWRDWNAGTSLRSRCNTIPRRRRDPEMRWDSSMTSYALWTAGSEPDARPHRRPFHPPGGIGAHRDRPGL